MKYPKSDKQPFFMGKKCVFDGVYYRDYGKEKTDYGQEYGYTRKVPVKWRISKHIAKEGWIVGFGFVFNGVIATEMDTGENCKFFRSSKRVNYVRVRVTPTSQEIKIPLRNIRFKNGDN